MPRYIVPVEFTVESATSEIAEQFIHDVVRFHVPHQRVDSPVVAYSIDTPELADEDDEMHVDRMSDDTLATELSFAEAALDEDDESTQHWYATLRAEQRRRRERAATAELDVQETHNLER